MKIIRLILLISTAAIPAAGSDGFVEQGVTIQGAGASYPYPAYVQWTYKYHRLTGVRINYQSIGSGAGITQMRAGTIDFGATDAPLQTEELKKYNLIQFPLIMGGVVPIVNLPGIQGGELRLIPSVLADIFMGNIDRWNDPRICEINPGLSLPDMEITVVYRADASGTTWIFTHYLNRISSEWKEKIGQGEMVPWPGDVGGKGNEGVALTVQRIPGTIGYVEFAYALQNSLTHAQLKNRAGQFVNPSLETFEAAASVAQWESQSDFQLVLTDQPGEKSWPIFGVSYVLIQKTQEGAEKAKTILDFFYWCFFHGDEIARDLQYIPIPDPVVQRVLDLWRTEISSPDGPIWN
jgi:phosphate transport system substrate-binding protein